MKFKNSQNGYVETICSLSWLMVLIFGPAYLAIKGLWRHFVLCLVLVDFAIGIDMLRMYRSVDSISYPFLCTAIIGIGIHVIYPFIIKNVLHKNYLFLGWSEVKK